MILLVNHPGILFFFCINEVGCEFFFPSIPFHPQWTSIYHENFLPFSSPLKYGWMPFLHRLSLLFVLSQNFFLYFLLRLKGLRDSILTRTNFHNSHRNGITKNIFFPFSVGKSLINFYEFSHYPLCSGNQ